MSLKAFIGKLWARNRAQKLRKIAANATGHQQDTFLYLVKQGRKTQFGQAHGFEDIQSVKDFQQRVPIRNYEQAKGWFDKIYQGEDDVMWPGKPLYLAKTSGTTSGAKYIPLTRESMVNQVRGARDTLLAYIADSGNPAFLDGKMMFLSGSPEIESNPNGIMTGRLSGISNHFVPNYLLRNRVPSWEANIIEDWETKVKTIVQEIKGEDLRLISGIPPWVQMLFEELQEQTGKGPLEVWPNLQVFVQGGVDYRPYQPIFDEYFGDRVDTVELYPASEGFFACQTSLDDDGLMLLPDNGIFYEFVPLAEYGKADARRLTLEEVELGEQYALIISTNAGLWGYDIGDTVKFTSLNPPKIRVSGRVKHHISAFGEHVISEEVNRAMMDATVETKAQVQEFTVAPLILEEKGSSAHEWFVEFTELPVDLDVFAEALDQSLRKQNPYYNDLREGNILRRAIVRKLELNATRAYMKQIGKLGGQNKFPRLSNNRDLVDKLTPWVIDA
ncbi:GH3 auxin-responsive promoter family protein [Pontibacter sp. G13]|uniref:GH3 auxin-responsive promoter family protein n=1 Tax=Pontibacter sp. G13 TaxID=3074898 RepID=UPI002889936A|nr:GH3 auxin-responsive promoter family protein [Pontibacter sp. G13]WNJ19586.1 GH3 auxin-responsive promoter family protein [Pontibacter sp. G13]